LGTAVTKLPRPKEGDVLTLTEEASDLDSWETGIVIQVHDSFDESWDPYGEHCMSQRDWEADYADGPGEWYAIIYHPAYPGETMAVGSYEVTEVRTPSSEEATLREWMNQFRELSQGLRETITPEFIQSLEPTEAAWLMEHLELLKEEGQKLHDKIDQHLEDRREQ